MRTQVVLAGPHLPALLELSLLLDKASYSVYAIETQCAVDRLLEGASDPDAAVVQPGIEIIDERGRPYRPLPDRVKAYSGPVNRDVEIRGEAAAISLLRSNWTYGPSLCYRSSFAKKLHLRPNTDYISDLGRIVDMMIGQLNENLAHKRLEVTITDEAKQWILDKACRDRNYGARPLRRAIQRYIEDPLSEALIQGNLKEMSKVEVYMDGGQLWYRPQDRDREEVGVPLSM